MKRLFKAIAVATLCLTLSVADSTAQTRPGRNTGTTSRNQGSRPGHNQGSRPGQNQGSRPNNGQTSRPGHGQTNYPDQNHQSPTVSRPGNSFRPGAVQPAPSRPDVNRPSRPGVNRPSRPGVNRPSRPGVNRPSRPGVNRPVVINRPYRPGLAPARPLRRPTPPAYWRPSRSAILWSNILGLTTAMAYNTAVNSLLQSGYAVNGYNGNEIYLTNVSQYNLNWPDATIYYSDGRLQGSRFYYSTPGYDNSRFELTYNYLLRTYGNPISINEASDGMSMTWFGSNNQYITLDFCPILTDTGRRYFTTLSIGL